MLNIEVVQLEHAKDLGLPRYMSDGASGLDLSSAIAHFSLKPMERKLVPTGLAIALPKGYEAQVRPRSGLALKKGLTCLNTPGTIDADYRGEIAVILINLGGQEVMIERGERIAQLVIQKVERVELKMVEKLDSTLRGEEGFGSTGK